MNKISHLLLGKPMRLYASILALFLVSGGMPAAYSTPTLIDPVVATIADRVIRESEVELLSNQFITRQPEINKSSLLMLLIRQSQIALWAESQGVSSTDQFNSSLAAHLNEKTVRGEFEQQVRERVMFEAYQRSRYLLRASHVLYPVAVDAKDTRVARIFELIEGHYKDIKSGKKTLPDLARAVNDLSESDEYEVIYSELDFFSVFEQVYPFESAAYKLNVGEQSPPFRTRYGFHIVRLDEKIRLKGVKSVTQILIHSRLTDNTADQASARERINKVYEMTKSRDFTGLVEEFSEDAHSIVKGGDLGSQRLVNELERVKASLVPGQVSQPVRTASGWHILKLTDLQPMLDYKSNKFELETKIKLDNRIERHMLALYQDELSSDIVDSVKKQYRERVLATLGLELLFPEESAVPGLRLLEFIDEHQGKLNVNMLDTKFPAVISQ